MKRVINAVGVTLASSLLLAGSDVEHTFFDQQQAQERVDQLASRAAAQLTRTVLERGQQAQRDHRPILAGRLLMSASTENGQLVLDASVPNEASVSSEITIGFTGSEATADQVDFVTIASNGCSDVAPAPDCSYDVYTITNNQKTGHWQFGALSRIGPITNISPAVQQDLLIGDGSGRPLEANDFTDAAIIANLASFNAEMLLNQP